MGAIPRLHKRFAFLPVALLALGCTESVESTDVKTTGIYPEIEVVANGNGKSKVTVKLKVGGSDSNTFLDLKGDDTLEVSLDGDDPVTLDQSGNSYSATFNTEEEGAEFTIAFLRGEDDDSAPASVVTLPAPFELSLSAEEASRADDFAYSWEPEADGNMDWRADGDCVFPESGDTPDDGENTLAADALEPTKDNEEESCTVDLELTRSQSGDIDSAFTEGGKIVAKQVRGASFTSTP